MLKKMIIHGLIAAAVIGGAAAVYASGPGDGHSVDNAAQAMRADAGNATAGNNGYITNTSGYSDRYRNFRPEREHERDHDHYGESSDHRREHSKRDDD
tara:strand:+ start:850 stop:1143 length:294 start_codon:yes stop_codon:yes gene_type:complete